MISYLRTVKWLSLLSQAPLIHKPAVGEINIIGKIHTVMSRTNGIKLVPFVTDYMVTRPFIFVSGKKMLLVDINNHT